MAKKKWAGTPIHTYYCHPVVTFFGHRSLDFKTSLKNAKNDLRNFEQQQISELVHLKAVGKKTQTIQPDVCFCRPRKNLKRA